MLSHADLCARSETITFFGALSTLVCRSRGSVRLQTIIRIHFDVRLFSLWPFPPVARITYLSLVERGLFRVHQFREIPPPCQWASDGLANSCDDSVDGIALLVLQSCSVRPAVSFSRRFFASLDISGSNLVQVDGVAGIDQLK